MDVRLLRMLGSCQLVALQDFQIWLGNQDFQGFQSVAIFIQISFHQTLSGQMTRMVRKKKMKKVVGVYTSPIVVRVCKIEFVILTFYSIFSSVRSFNSYPDLLVIHQHPLFQIQHVCHVVSARYQYHAILCSTMQYRAIPCNTMQYPVGSVRPFLIQRIFPQKFDAF